MISVMNNDCKIERTPEAETEKENQESERGFEGGADGSLEDKRANVTPKSSEETRVPNVQSCLEASHSESVDRVMENERSEEARRCSAEEVGARAPVGEGADVEMGTKVVKNEDENASNNEAVGNELQNDQLKPQDDRFDARDNGTDSDSSRSVPQHVQSGRLVTQIDPLSCENNRMEGLSSKTETTLYQHRGVASQYSTLLSEFDDYVAGGQNGTVSTGTSRALRFGFEVGDMVWGKVKSHPWWPGHIFNEAYASPSVRYTRKHGHVLVAFFGDSSYGWFDPAELIPFGPNFAEKSQQTNARTFVRAVEEAVDEASRRSALGLGCKCRNPYNFRPTNVQGYFAVDVPDYEPGGIYSVNQINKARDNFKPRETLNFVKQLAMAPQNVDHRSIDQINKKAIVFAFRKAIYEEFDETYAQAFGVQPSRPSENQAAVSNQPLRGPSRAPLSGPLVVAEALVGVKSSTKPLKVKTQSKKDRYLLKRRDEASESKANQIASGKPRSSVMTAYMEGSQAAAAGEYVLQKRFPAVPMKTDISAKLEQTGFGGEGLVISPSKAPVSVEKEYDATENMNKKSGSHVAITTKSTGPSDLLGKEPSTGLVEGTSKLSDPILGGPSDMQMPHSLLEVKHDVSNSSGLNSDGGLKKAKIIKRPPGESTYETFGSGEKKKKKRKKDILKPGGMPPQKKMIAGKDGPSTGKVGGKYAENSLSPGENAWADQQRQHDFSGNHICTGIGTLPLVGVGNVDIGLPQLLSGLHGLALDPFHEVERNCPANVRQCFLRFRSQVYQKSLVSLPPSDAEPEVNATKPPGVLSSEEVRPLPSSKPVKPAGRFDDPTKGGRKRLPSDRQEENAARRLKKIKDMKSLAAEKRTSLKNPETQRVEGKETLVSVPQRGGKADLTKKVHPSSKPIDPTALVMKFPPQTSLPSVAELKARFARFGPLDHSALRVFWKSSTCRVVFRHKLDAQAALKYATGNNNLFGNVSVRYFLRELEASAPEVPEAVKSRVDDPVSDTAKVKDPAVERPLPSLVHPPPQQPVVQLKSCLKRSTGDEGGSGTGNGSRGAQRVKFMLGGEETTSRVEQLGGNRDNSNNASYGDGSPSSIAVDFNIHKVISSPSSPISIPPPHFAKTGHDNLPQSIIPNMNAPSFVPGPCGVDVSQQMLSLMTRCKDVVANVTKLLGYVPYHPL